MDPVLSAVIVVGIVAVVVIVMFVIYRRSGGADWILPFGMRIKMGGTNQSPPTDVDMDIGTAKAGRDLTLHEQAGGTVKAKELEAGQDMMIRRSKTETTPNPKVEPPTKDRG